MDHDGDFSAFAAARWANLVRSAVFLGCSVHEAQDVAQATLVRCYTSWKRVARADDRDAYVFKVLVNALRDSRRRRWWGEQPTSDLPEPDPSQHGDPHHDTDVSDAVTRALAKLSPEHRAVVTLRYLAHLSEQQTATALGIPAGTVKSRLARALAHLGADPTLAELVEGARP